MAVTVVTRTSKAKPAEGKKPAKAAFTYDKIITPNTKRGGKDEAETSSFPTLAELANHLGGKVEYNVVKDADGKESASDDCLVGYAIAGLNLAMNQRASFAAGNTVENALSKMDEMLADIAKRFGKTTQQILI